MKYCKKSSVQSVADEIKVRAGKQGQTIPFSNFVSEINNIVIPTQQSTSYITLDRNNTSYTIPRGIHSGNGTVTVNPQAKTAQLSQGGSTIYPDSGKVLSSVTVPAKNTVSVASGTITMSSGQSSVSITGLPFSPIGYALCFNISSVNTSKISGRILLLMQTKSGTLLGRIMHTDTISSGNGMAGIPITSVNTTWGSNSLSISNIEGTLSGTTYNGTFSEYTFRYVVWG